MNSKCYFCIDWGSEFVVKFSEKMNDKWENLTIGFVCIYIQVYFWVLQSSVE